MVKHLAHRGLIKKKLKENTIVAFKESFKKEVPEEVSSYFIDFNGKRIKPQSINRTKEKLEIDVSNIKIGIQKIHSWGRGNLIQTNMGILQSEK